MQNNQTKYLNVSFHDLAPHTWQLCETFIHDMHKIGVYKINLLLVPNWYHQFPLTEHHEFCEWVRAKIDEGHEVCLHGYSHLHEVIKGGLLTQVKARIYTAKEDEFSQLNYNQALERLNQGMEIFGEINVQPQGFVAPAWLLSSEAEQALKDLEFLFTTRLLYLKDLRSNISHFAPAIVWSCRSTWRRVVSKYWVNFFFNWHQQTKLLRVAIHPRDLHYPEIQHQIRRIILNAMKNRQINLYSELIQNFNNHQPQR